MDDMCAACADFSAKLAGPGMTTKSCKPCVCVDTKLNLPRRAALVEGGSRLGDGAISPRKSGQVCSAEMFGSGSFALCLALLYVSVQVFGLELCRSMWAPSSQRIYISVDDRMRILGGGSICRHGIESPSRAFHYK